MKAKTLLTAIILLIASLSCLGLMSCGSAMTPPLAGAAEATGENNHDTTPAATGTGLSGGTTDIQQELSEDAYRDEIAAIAGELSEAFYELDGLLVNPELESDDWIAMVMLSIADIFTLCDEAEEIVPPDTTVEVHVTCLEALMHFSDAIDLLLTGIEEADTGLIDQASGEMWLASEILSGLVTSG